MADIFDSVMREVCRHFGVTTKDIRSNRRTRAILSARHTAAYLMQKVSGLSAAEIGVRLGGRDYTNILMYCRAVARRAGQDDDYRQELAALEARIRDRSIGHNAE